MLSAWSGSLPGSRSPGASARRHSESWKSSSGFTRPVFVTAPRSEPYGEFCSGSVWSLAVHDEDVSTPRREPFAVPDLSSFGEGAAGELYLVSLDGVIYRLRG